MAGTYLDINSNRRATIRFVDQANTVNANTFIVDNWPLTSMNITRILWTGPGWSIQAGTTTVFDCGNATWGVIDLGERGNAINIPANTAITSVNTAPAGTLIIELTKATN